VWPDGLSRCRACSKSGMIFAIFRPGDPARCVVCRGGSPGKNAGAYDQSNRDPSTARTSGTPDGSASPVA